MDFGKALSSVVSTMADDECIGIAKTTTAGTLDVMVSRASPACGGRFESRKAIPLKEYIEANVKVKSAMLDAVINQCRIEVSVAVLQKMQAMSVAAIQKSAEINHAESVESPTSPSTTELPTGEMRDGDDGGKCFA